MHQWTQWQWEMQNKGNAKCTKGKMGNVQDLPESGQNLARTWPDLAGIWTDAVQDLARLWQDLAGIRPDSGKIWPESDQNPARSGKNLARFWQDLARIKPDPGKFFWIHALIMVRDCRWQDMAKSLQHSGLILVRFCQNLAGFWQDLARTWPDSGQLWQTLARSWQGLVKSWQDAVHVLARFPPFIVWFVI